GGPERAGDPYQQLRRNGAGGHHRGGDHPGAPRDGDRSAGRGAAGGDERRRGGAATGRGGALVANPRVGPGRGGAKGGGGGRTASGCLIASGRATSRRQWGSINTSFACGHGLYSAVCS